MHAKILSLLLFTSLMHLLPGSEARSIPKLLDQAESPLTLEPHEVIYTGLEDELMQAKREQLTQSQEIAAHQRTLAHRVSSSEKGGSIERTAQQEANTQTDEEPLKSPRLGFKSLGRHRVNNRPFTDEPSMDVKETSGAKSPREVKSLGKSTSKTSFFTLRGSRDRNHQNAAHEAQHSPSLQKAKTFSKGSNSAIESPKSPRQPRPALSEVVWKKSTEHALSQILASDNGNEIPADATYEEIIHLVNQEPAKEVVLSSDSDRSLEALLTSLQSFSAEPSPRVGASSGRKSSDGKSDSSPRVLTVEELDNLTTEPLSLKDLEELAAETSFSKKGFTEELNDIMHEELGGIDNAGELYSQTLTTEEFERFLLPPQRQASVFNSEDPENSDIVGAAEARSSFTQMARPQELVVLTRSSARNRSNLPSSPQLSSARGRKALPTSPTQTEEESAVNTIQAVSTLSESVEKEDRSSAREPGLDTPETKKRTLRGLGLSLGLAPRPPKATSQKLNSPHSHSADPSPREDDHSIQKSPRTNAKAAKLLGITSLETQQSFLEDGTERAQAGAQQGDLRSSQVMADKASRVLGLSQEQPLALVKRGVGAQEKESVEDPLELASEPHKEIPLWVHNLKADASFNEIYEAWLLEQPEGVNLQTSDGPGWSPAKFNLYYCQALDKKHASGISANTIWVRNLFIEWLDKGQPENF